MRHTSEVKIDAEGRDKGKTFVITEMAASKAERWAIRALLVLAKSGVDVGDPRRGGMAEVAVAGLQSLPHLDIADVDPLMQEMFDCIQIKESETVTRKLVEEDIEEVMTRIQLRVEVFSIHTGFSSADLMSKLNSTKSATA